MAQAAEKATDRTGRFLSCHFSRPSPSATAALLAQVAPGENLYLLQFFALD